MTYDEHVAYYDVIYEHFPEQQHGDLTAIREFFSGTQDPETVLEIGGWNGAIAGMVLGEFPQVTKWYNFELCRPAIAHGLKHSRYTARVLPDFVWNVPELPACSTFFAAHTIEHMRARELLALFARLHSARRMYLEAPLPQSATAHDWSGRWSTHILEIGWNEVESLAQSHGFQVTHRAPNLRTFAR